MDVPALARQRINMANRMLVLWQRHNQNTHASSFSDGFCSKFRESHCATYRRRRPFLVGWHYERVVGAGYGRWPIGEYLALAGQGSVRQQQYHTGALVNT